MTTPPKSILTAEEFSQHRDELPDGGRWTDLIAGQPVTLSPPDTEHGTAVLNLSKALADHVGSGHSGYACFELGLLLQRQPDTALFPAISFFTQGDRFAEADKVFSDTRPQLVVEVASSNDRRRQMAQRVESWRQWSVDCIWIVDPHARQVHVFDGPRGARVLTNHETLQGGGALTDFAIRVEAIFAEPTWWRGR